MDSTFNPITRSCVWYLLDGTKGFQAAVPMATRARQDLIQQGRYFYLMKQIEFNETKES